MYVGMGKPYQIQTSVPLIGTFTADIPVDQMTSDAMDYAEARTKAKLPYLIGGLVVVVGLTVGLVGLMLGRR